MVVLPDKFTEILDHVAERLAQANEDGTLHQLLCMLGLQGLVDVDDNFDLGDFDAAYNDILVLGNCEVRKEVLQGVGRDLGYDKARFKFVDYDSVTKFDFGNIRYSTSYAAVLCGPMPHKANAMGDATSILEELRHPENGYPPIAELRESGGKGELRINKTTFRAALAELEQSGKIKPN